MEQLPINIEPEEKRNYKAILLIVVVGIIVFAAFYSYQSKYAEEPSGNIHATIVEDMVVQYSSVKATLLNDGVSEWDIVNVDIFGADARCGNLAKNVKPNGTAVVSCRAYDVTTGTSYSFIITLANVEDESDKFKIQGSVIAQG